MGEGAAAVAVAKRPDVRDAGPQFVVDHDKATRVDSDARRVKPEIVGVRPAADGDEHVRADHEGLAASAGNADLDVFAARGEADALRITANGDSLRLQDAANRIRHVRVFSGDETRRLFDHGDVGAQSPEYLGELETDVAAADNRQMTRQSIEFEQGRVCQRADLIDTREIWDRGPGPYVDEDPIGLERFTRDFDRVWGNEAGVALDHLAVSHALKPGFEARALFANDALHARHDCREIDADRSSADTIVGGAAGEMGRIGARDESLGGSAAHIHAGPAEELALDKSDRLALAAEPSGHRRSCLASPYDDGVEAMIHRSARLVLRSDGRGSFFHIEFRHRQCPDARAGLTLTSRLRYRLLAAAKAAQ